MQTLSESEALSIISDLALSSGLEVVSGDVERSDLSNTMPIVNIYVSMISPQRVYSDMLALESQINSRFGGKCRTGVYYAEIGYDEIPQGQAQIQIDMLEFELTSDRLAHPHATLKF